MLKMRFSYLLVILIALQSFAAIADTHQEHQSGEQHLTFTDDHTQTPQEITQPQQLEESTKLPDDALDCHHCCHCHLHIVYLAKPSLIFESSFKSLEQNEYHNAALSGLMFSLFRPPKFNSTITNL